MSLLHTLIPFPIPKSALPYNQNPSRARSYILLKTTIRTLMCSNSISIQLICFCHSTQSPLLHAQVRPISYSDSVLNSEGLYSCIPIRSISHLLKQTSRTNYICSRFLNMISTSYSDIILSAIGPHSYVINFNPCPIFIRLI